MRSPVVGCSKFLSFITLFLIPVTAQAQLVINSPDINGGTTPACDDYATAVLNDPWDMNSATDINNYVKPADFTGFTNVQFANGEFVATAATADPYFHILSPPLSSSQPASGRFGSEYPIDTSKYYLLFIRMYSSVPSAMQIVWNRGTDYFPNFTITNSIFTQAGWHVYTIDLNNIGTSGPAGPWNAGTVTGLRIDPTVVPGAEIRIDWISLRGNAGCGSFPVSYTATPSGGEDRLSLYLDEDSDPFNGYVQQLLAGEAAVGAGSVAAQPVVPGNLAVNGFLSGDYATLMRSDPWDMSGAGDVYVTQYVNNGSTADGVFSGTTSNNAAVVYLSVPSSGIDAARYSKLSIKLGQSVLNNFSIIWQGTGGVGQAWLSRFVNDPDGNGVYTVDLSTYPVWQGTINALTVNPASAGGVSFSIDFVSLRSNGYVAALAAPQIVQSAGPLRVNKAPLVQMLQPDAKGGQGLFAWNMSGLQDIALVQGVDVAEILPFNSVYGLTGDFFHGSNPEGTDDPINYSSFFTVNPAAIDTSVYHNLTYKLLVEGDFDLVLGSVARVYWSDAGTAWGQSQDIVVFEGWNEYTVDLATIGVEEGSTTWNGVINSFRVDSHEFLQRRGYYFDYIHLRADDRANSNFAVTFNVTDSDGRPEDTQISLYYTPNRSTSDGLLIDSFLLSETTGVYVWDTSNVAPGSYYVYAVVNDGFNTTTRLSTGRAVVTRSWEDSVAPVLSVETPAAAAVFGDYLQVKGFSLDAVQLAAVNIYIDSVHVARLHPSEYSAAAKAAYPTYVDSSNAGFNTVFDTTALTDGVHTLLVRAVDTAGRTNDYSVDVHKLTGAAQPLIGDPTPNGTPILVPLSRTGGGGGGGGPVTPAPVAASFKVSSRGDLSGRLSSLTSGCTVAIYGGISNAVVNTSLASFTANAALASMTAKKVPGYKGNYFIRAIQTCNGSARSSNVTKMTFSSKKKTATNKLVASLRKMRKK